MCPDLEDYALTDHAIIEMQRRNIREEDIDAVLLAPEQCTADRPGRCVYQARRMDAQAGKVYLFRVFVDVDRNPPQVVTAYKTSKVQKYWRTDDARDL